MRTDFELQRFPVEIKEPTSSTEDFLITVEKKLIQLHVGVCLCNTMMRYTYKIDAGIMSQMVLWV